jgi:hypothetical protein
VDDISTVDGGDASEAGRAEAKLIRCAGKGRSGKVVIRGEESGCGAGTVRMGMDGREEERWI